MNTIKGIIKTNTGSEILSGYSFLTLTPSEITLEGVENTGRDEYNDEESILANLDDFFYLYLNKFEGDERDPIEGILSRVLPKENYREENKIKKLKKTLNQLCKEKYENEKLSKIDKKSKIDNITSSLIEEMIKRDNEKANSNIKDDQTILHICRNPNGKVIAGMILEFYAKRNNGTPFSLTNFQPRSSLILTYLFVTNDQKKKGIGSYMVKNELKIITNNFVFFKEIKDKKETLLGPDFVFFEVENPLFLKEDSVNKGKDNENMRSSEDVDKKVNNRGDDEKADYVQSVKEKECLGKLTFFQKVGARWIDIPYVQPSLAEGKERVYNLFFMILPELSRGVSDNPFIINKYHVLDFLISFYNTNEKKSYTFSNFYPKNHGSSSELGSSLPTIIDEDPDLSRILLSIEIADALDDLENQGYQITKQEVPSVSSSNITPKELPFKLKELQKNIEEQFKNIANLKDKSVKYEITKSILRKYFKEILIYKSKIKDAFDNDNFYLKEVPKFSTPKLLLNKSSIAFHIALNPSVKHKHFVYKEYKEKKKKEAFIFSLINSPFLVTPFVFENNFKSKLIQTFSPVDKNDLDKRETYYEYKLKDEDRKYIDEPISKKVLIYKEKDKNNKTELIDFNKLRCPIFRSYENDLLASNYYEEKAPIRSKHIKSFKLTINFPYKIEFLSEGRKETLFVNRKPDNYAKSKSDKNYSSYSKTVKCFLNMMFFKPDEYKALSEEYSKISSKQNPTQKEIQIIIDYEVALAKNIIWELVFTNDVDEKNNTRIALTEFEIIQLSKFFSGKQEKSTIQIKFVDPKQKNENTDVSDEIINILNGLINKTPSIYNVHSGTIQIDTNDVKILGKRNKNKKEELDKPSYYYYEPLFLEQDNDNDESNESEKYKPYYLTSKSRINSLLEEYLKDNVDNIDLMNEIYYKTQPKGEAISNLEIYRNARNFHFDDSFTGFEDRYNENEFMKYFFDTMCGIALGIFDYGRMGYEEVTDTISPLNESATDKAMIIMKRDTIFSLCHNNSVYESSIATIGISPYLIIPNSILVYNRIQAEQSKAFFNDVFSLTKDDISNKDFLVTRENAKNSLGISNNELYQLLLVLRKRIETYLDKVNIPNVFNYGTEREIYDTGMNDRGVEESISQIKETKNELDESIKDILEIRQSIFENLTTIFLGILSFVGLWDPIVNHLDVEREGFYIANGFLQGKYTFNLGAILLIILFIGFVLYFGRKLKNILPQHVTVDWPKFFYKTIIPIAIALLFFLLYFFVFFK